MGFRAQMDAILDNLSACDRQTLLFSATQTKSVAQLARVSLRSPVYVSVHENANTSTPEQLKQVLGVTLILNLGTLQTYMVCTHEQKINILYSFLLAHHRSKVLVFMNSCKQVCVKLTVKSEIVQVRFMRVAMRALRCGLTSLALHGALAQTKRVHVYDEFARCAQGVVLFATDVCARGLDFADVDWVVQV
jgi:ATP-dependent RNA helicase DDX10/DBP4